MTDISENLLPCPFCGNRPTISHTGLAKINTSNLPSYLQHAEYSTEWIVKCRHCGISRGKEKSYYIFTKNGELKTLDKENGKKRAIELWNTRANVETKFEQSLDSITFSTIATQ